MGRPVGSKEVKIQKLREIVQGNPHLSNHQIAEMLGVCSKSVSCYLKTLRQQNEILVDVSRVRLSGGWYVVRKITFNEESV